jgi:tetratricopeptide (TPR) repeat protein
MDPIRERKLKRQIREYALWGGLIVLITFLAYTPALRGGFIWDDSLITKNRLVKAGDGLYRFWFTTQAPDYYPLTWTLWWVEWRLWGNHATGYHVVNVLLHAVNAILVWMVLRRLKIPGAWLAGLVFAVHPVNVATAAWISEQKNTLSMLFYLMAILLYLQFDEEEVRWRWYGLSLVAFLLALLSKTAVVMLPVVLLGCVWWRHGRIRRRDWLRIVPFLVLSLVLGLVTVWFQHNRALGGYAVRTDSFLVRLIAAGWVPWFYLCKAVWPSGLNVIYPKWQIDATDWVSYVPGIMLLGCLAVFWCKRDAWGRPLLFAFGYFVVTLFPVLGFVDQGFYEVSLVADHWQYYSIIGIIALITGGGVAICRRWGKQGRYAGEVASLAMVIVLTAATWTRSGVYADSRTLWQDTLAKHPNAWIAHNNLGFILASEGDLVDATRHYEEALRLDPDYAAAHNNLGTALLRTGNVAEAIRHLQRAVDIEPDWAAAHNNLGGAFLQAGEIQDAIKQFGQAVQIDPDYADAHYNLGNALWKAGRKQEAIEHYEKATVLNPDFAQAHNNLGVLLQADNLPQAIAHYERALRIDPNYAEAHFNLGKALVQSGKDEEAIAQYQQALRLKPDYADAHYDLAVLLAREGKIDEAILHLKSGLKLEPNSDRFRRAMDELERPAGAGKS